MPYFFNAGSEKQVEIAIIDIDAFALFMLYQKGTRCDIVPFRQNQSFTAKTNINQRNNLQNDTCDPSNKGLFGIAFTIEIQFNRMPEHILFFEARIFLIWSWFLSILNFLIIYT